MSPRDLTDSISPVLGLQAHITMPNLSKNNFYHVYDACVHVCGMWLRTACSALTQHGSQGFKLRSSGLIANSLYPLSHVYPIKVLFVSVLV